MTAIKNGVSAGVGAVKQAATPGSLRAGLVAAGEKGEEVVNANAAPGDAEQGTGAADSTPGAGDATPGAGDSTPGAGDATPGAGDATPGAADATPGAGDATPGAGDATPGAGDATPGAGDATPGAGEQVVTWAAANPGTAACVGAGTIGIVLLAAPMAAAAPLLGIVGFGPAGVVGGSMAAGAQAGIGSVVAGSTFATLQSAAMGGYGVAAVAGVVQTAGVAIAGTAGGLATWLRTKRA